MLLNEIYEELRNNGFTTSYVEFSIKWLNKSARYMSMLRASGREPSVDTLARLLANLKLHYDGYKDSQYNVIRHKAVLIEPVLKRTNRALLVKASDRHGW